MSAITVQPTVSGIGLEPSTVANITDADRLFALNHLNDKMTNAVLPVTIFVALEAVMGFFGNIMVIYVFAFHYKSCNFRYFVLCLACTDLCSSLTTIPGEVVTQLHWFTYPYPLICKIKSFFNVFTVSAEAFALVTIAVDRYLKVCWPFGFQISPRIAKYLILVIFTTATILALPVSFYWGTHQATELYMNMNITVTVCEIDEKYVGTKMPQRYSLSIEGIIGATLVIMFVLYILVARRLLMNKSTTNMSISEPSTKAVTGGVHSNPQTVEKKDKGKTNGQTMETLNVSPLKRGADSAYSSSASSSGAAPAIQNLGYISDDDGISSSDIEATFPERKRKRTMIRTRTARGTARNSNRRGRLRRKTLIMVILTVAFMITTIMYLTLLSFIAKGVLRGLNDVQKAVYFFFFRFYFINHVINPIIYGLLDPTFQRVLRGCREGAIKGSSSGPASSSRD